VTTVNVCYQESDIAPYREPAPQVLVGKCELSAHSSQPESCPGWPAEGGRYPSGVDFSFDHYFDAPIDVVAEAILDIEYQHSLDELELLEKRHVLEQTEKGDGRVVRRTRCVLGVDLGAAKRFLGDAEPAWVEEATWDPKGWRWDWVILPEVAAELLSSHGTMELLEDGEGTLRRVTGTVKIKVPLYGGRVENTIVEGLERAYEEEAERLERWLEE
jgi:hypothetical protein